MSLHSFYRLAIPNLFPMKSFKRFLTLFFFPILVGCLSSKPQVTVHALPNYNQKAAHQILFLDFAISRANAGKLERVTLTNSIMGTGELKNLNAQAHTPYQIKLRSYYSTAQASTEENFEHPLFRSIEIADADGTLTRKLTSDSSGHLSVRLPYTPALTKLELYRVTPGEGMQKLYTLQVKL